MKLNNKGIFKRSRAHQHIALSENHLAILSNQDCAGQLDISFNKYDQAEEEPFDWKEDFGLKNGRAKSAFVIHLGQESLNEGKTYRTTCIPLTKLMDELRFRDTAQSGGGSRNILNTKIWLEPGSSANDTEQHSMDMNIADRFIL